MDCKAPKRFSGLKLESLVLSEVEKLITKDSFAEKLLFEVRRTHKAPDQETSNLESLKARETPKRGAEARRGSEGAAGLSAARRRF